MNKKYSALLFVLLMIVGFLSAQKITSVKNPSVFKAKLMKQSKETTSIISSFTQDKYVSFMNAPQHAEGLFYYQRTNKMRWEQNTPFSYVLMINGEKVRIKDNGKEKKIIGANKMMGKINTLMLGLINGEIFENKDFIPSYFETKDFFIVKLIPKNKRLKSVFDSIELSFSKNTTRLKELTFFEKSGDKSVMKFFNEKFNQIIKESLFIKL